MRQAYGLVSDDGTFVISFAAYFAKLAFTAICVEANSDYNHNHVVCDLTPSGSVEFTFEVKETIPAADTFTILVA